METISEVEQEGRYYVEVHTPAGLRSGVEDFLPAPFNVGKTRGDKGELDVLLLRDALGVGSRVAFEPIGAVMLDSAGVRKTVVVGVPVDPALKTLNVQNLEDLLTEYEAVRNMTQVYIVNHKGFGAFELVGWQDEKFVRSILHTSQ